MARPKSHHVCQACGYQTPAWMGRCPDCGQWGTLVEERPRSPAAGDGRRSRPDPGGGPVAITAVRAAALERLSTGLGELDRVLGGGLIPGSLVLLGGDPGIGKSTLVLQASGALAAAGPVLYVTGEESPEQARARAERVGALAEGLYLAAETCLEIILRHAETLKPRTLVLDSVQTTYSEELESVPGSIGQVREVATRLLRFAKAQGIATLLIGHVTKEGTLAGPKALEHLVDTVISFEGDRDQALRILRATKNRFGPTDEVGVFRMEAGGLREVANPSELFLSERPAGAPGSVVLATVEGTRPILVEVQALVARAGAGPPRRVVNGLDYNRTAMILAVAEKHLGLPVGMSDVFLNVAGGVRIQETAADLGVMAAVASSCRNLPLDPGTAVFGEVGLAGEVRVVAHTDRRAQEVARLGLTRCLLPRGSATPEKRGLALVPVATVAQAAAALFGQDIRL